MPRSACTSDPVMKSRDCRHSEGGIRPARSSRRPKLAFAHRADHLRIGDLTASAMRLLQWKDAHASAIRASPSVTPQSVARCRHTLTDLPPDVATLSPICQSRRPQPSEHTRLAMSALGEMRPRRCEQRIRCCSAVAAIGGEGTSFRLGRYHFNGLIKSGRGTWPIDSAATCFGKVRTPRR